MLPGMTAAAIAAHIATSDDYNILLTDKQIKRINKRMRKATASDVRINHDNQIWWVEL